MSPQDAAGIIADLADGLRAIHDQGLIHGGITRARIILDENHPRLESVPVGLHQAPETVGALLCGVSSYTPPEWLRSDSSLRDPRGDIYALGVVLYEMLTGRLPFSEDGGPQALVIAIARGAPTPPRRIDRSIPAKLEAICLKAMAKDPAARYATAGELAAALRDFLKPRRKAFWK